MPIIEVLEHEGRTSFDASPRLLGANEFSLIEKPIGCKGFIPALHQAKICLAKRLTIEQSFHFGERESHRKICGVPAMGGLFEYFGGKTIHRPTIYNPKKLCKTLVHRLFDVDRLIACQNHSGCLALAAVGVDRILHTLMKMTSEYRELMVNLSRPFACGETTCTQSTAISACGETTCTQSTAVSACGETTCTQSTALFACGETTCTQSTAVRASGPGGLSDFQAELELALAS